MKQFFETLEEANLFIEKVNILLGYPNEANGTLTYSVPELIEVKEDETVISTHWEVDITQELNEVLVELATKQLLQ